MLFKMLENNVQMFQEFVHFCVVFSHVVYHNYSVGKGLNLCIFNMFDHICSGLKKSKFLWVFAYGLSYLQWSQKRSKFVYFGHVLPYLQWSEKV